MRHDVGVLWPDRSEEVMHVDFVQYGDPKKYTAMAATVGFPTAIATKMILEGTYILSVATQITFKDCLVTVLL